MGKLVWGVTGDISKSISLQVDEVGVVTVTEVVICKSESRAAAALDIADDDCPLDLARPLVRGSSADRMEAGMWQVTRNFSALLDESLIGDYKIYKCDTIANREPIQTHPKFKFFAGTSSSPVNGSVWDQGQFVRFKPYVEAGEAVTQDGELTTAPKFAKNRKCGISDFFSPIVHFSQSSLILEENLAAQIEELSTIEPRPPTTPMRPFWAKRTWLLTKCDPKWVAKETYRLDLEWSLSGPRGWDADIYTK